MAHERAERVFGAMFPEERWVKDYPEVGVEQAVTFPRNGRSTIKVERDVLRELLVAAGYRLNGEPAPDPR